MDESKRRAARFLEKEIETYRALALFFSKKEIKKHVSAKDKAEHGHPTYYKKRIGEARKLVRALRQSD